MYPFNFFIGLIVVWMTLLFAKHVAGYDMSQPGSEKQRLQTSFFVDVVCALLFLLGGLALISYRSGGWVSLA